MDGSITDQQYDGAATVDDDKDKNKGKYNIDDVVIADESIPEQKKMIMPL